MDNTKNKRGRESHYDDVLESIMNLGPSVFNLGIGTAWAYYDDPKHLLFTLSRYKFASKIFVEKKNVLEIGCGDGFATRILLQTVNNIVAIDVDEQFISDAVYRYSEKWPIHFRRHDIILDGPIYENFEAILCLDVMEHIEKSDHCLLLKNIVSSLSDNGLVIIGMPSYESQAYASPQSKLGHVACLTQNELKDTLGDFFVHVFIFSMNDEIVHTGFSKMSHYNLAVCCQPRSL